MKDNNYTAEQAYAASLEYFKGDELATSTFVSKYALKVPSEDGGYIYEEKTPSDMHDRLAGELARIEGNYKNSKSYDTIRISLDGFLHVVPAGSVMSGLGNPYVNVSLSNCVASAGPKDSITGIFDKARDMANLYKARAGFGLPLDTLRPDGSKVNNSAGTSSGAWSFGNFYSEVCKTIGQLGRRGALLLTMQVNHPDIEQFVTMKRDLTKVTGANISVMITNEFMQAVKENKEWVLHWPVDKPIEEAKYIKTIQAKDLWDLICESATKYAEPGIIFIDNYRDNLPADKYPEFKSVCCNPCVTADTWVMTNKGPFLVENLIGSSFNAIVNGKSYCSTNEGFFLTGRKPIYSIKTDRGFELKATEDHPIYVKIGNINPVYKWKNVSELKIGDKIVLHNHNNFSWDGIYCEQSGDIEKQSSDFYRGFLQGKFDENGIIINSKNKGTRVRLFSSNLEELHSIQRMLARLGVISTVRTNKLTIAKENVIHFVKRIGFSGSLKNFSLIKQFKSNNELNCYESFTSKVQSIDLIGEELVYDCQIPGINAFDANGLYVHNCGEVLLSDFDSCRLTNINLKSFVINPYTDEAYFDYDKFAENVHLAMRMLDDIVDLEIECLQRMVDKIDEPSEKELWGKLINAGKRGRRTGLGTHGLADALIGLQIKYDSQEAQNEVDKIYECLKVNAYDESVNMAIERGAFPCFDWETEKDCIFIQRLPQWLQDRIKTHGRRNVSLLTNAPTGSVSIVSQTSSGIEPVYMLNYTRRKKINASDSNTNVDFTDDTGDRWTEFAVLHHSINDYFELHPELKEKWEEIQKTIKSDEWENELHNLLPDYFITAMQIDPMERVKIQGVLTAHLDHGSSSTINCPKNTPVSAIQAIYESAWEHGLKGVTVYVDGSRSGVLVSKKSDELGDIFETKAPKRAKSLPCEIHHSQIDGMKWVIIVGILNGKPYEIFGGRSENVVIPKKFSKGKMVKRKSEKINGKGRFNCYDLILGDDDDPLVIADVVCTFDNGDYAAATRLISLSLRHGVPVHFIAEQLGRDADSSFMSFSKVISRILRKYISDGIVSGEICPSCGARLIFSDGCCICMSCSHSKCS